MVETKRRGRSLRLGRGGRDLHATMLQLMAVDAKRLSYPFHGLDQQLVGVKPAKVIEGILA